MQSIPAQKQEVFLMEFNLLAALGNDVGKLKEILQLDSSTNDRTIMFRINGVTQSHKSSHQGYSQHA
jgi:hypothetical protein